MISIYIPRYVDTFVPEPPVNLGKVADKLVATDKEINQTQTKLVGMLKELTSSDNSLMQDLDKIINALGGNTNDR